MAEEFDASKMAEALAPLLGLELKPEYRAGVKANLETALRMARLLEEVPLSDEAEPAPVFSA
jgi:Protein of unknown function (DUF4089)